MEAGTRTGPVSNETKSSIDLCPERVQHDHDVAAHLTALIESTQDLIFSVDLDYRLVTFNNAFAQYMLETWGVTPRAGMSARDIVTPSQAALWSRMFVRAIDDGAYRTELVLPDGRLVDLSFNLIVVAGATVGISVFGKDLSERIRAEEALHASLEQTIKLISETIEQRDPYTAGHQRRVADLCTRIAEKMDLDPYRIHGLRLASTIHDVGKIGIPAEILAKPGRLTAIQFELIKEHVDLGYDIVKNVSFPWPIAEMIRQHHERLDGSGYPLGLSGDSILLEARILAVADVVESISSHRPYRATMGMDAALSELLSGRGRLYEPDAVDACMSLFQTEGYAFPP
jgi:PAS domain S-box-containing protein